MKHRYKRLLSSVMAILMAASLASIAPPATAEVNYAFADDSTGVELWYCILTENGDVGTVEVFSGLGETDPDVTKITIPSDVWYSGKKYTVTDIGGSAFSRFARLSDISIPNTVTNIGSFAFWGCKSLVSIAIPDSVTSIGDAAFSNCTSLATIVIPGSVKTIGNSAFAVCESLAHIDIPEGVESIGEQAFYICENLESIQIPSSVTYIGDGAFAICPQLTDLIVSADNPAYTAQTGILFNKQKDTLLAYPSAKGLYSTPAGVTHIGNSAFYGAELEKVNVSSDVIRIGDYAFTDCYYLTQITIPDSVTSIGDYAFRFCHTLPSIFIPNSVLQLGEGVFSGCTQLTNFDLDSQNSLFSAEGGALFDNQKTTLIAYPSAKGAYEIPDGARHIADEAFFFCTKLESVTIPDSVISIGDSAFFFCEGLESVTIPENVTSIGDSAFELCQNIRSIVIPDGVTRIGDGTFYFCESLTSVHIPEGVTSIGRSAFELCKNLKNISIPASVETIGDMAFFQCEGLQNIRFSGSAPSVGHSTFDFVAPNAVAYVYPSAKGFPAEGALWNGLTIKYRSTITAIDTGAISTLASGYAANLPVNVTGENLSGKDLIIRLKNESGEAIYESVPMAGADNFSTTLKLDKETLTLPKGTYTVETAIDGETASTDIYIAETGPDLWLVKATVGLYVDEPVLLIQFLHDGFQRTFTGNVFVDGVMHVDPIYYRDEYDGRLTPFIILRDLDLAMSHTVKITGVKYSELFPSYKFTFTVEYTA